MRLSRGSFTESGGVRQWKRQRKLGMLPRMLLGAHESVAGGPHTAIARGRADGCEAIQIFARPSAQWRAQPFLPEEVSLFRSEHATVAWPTMSHASYLINLAADDPAILDQRATRWRTRCSAPRSWGSTSCVLHPGAHLGAGVEDGVAAAADSLSELDARTRGLAGPAAAGDHRRPGELSRLPLRGAGGDPGAGPRRRPPRVCFDTCHALAAGYDLSTEEGYERTFDAFARSSASTSCGRSTSTTRRPRPAAASTATPRSATATRPLAVLAAGERPALRDHAGRAGDAVGPRRAVLVRAQPGTAPRAHRRATPGGPAEVAGAAGERRPAAGAAVFGLAACLHAQASQRTSQRPTLSALLGRLLSALLTAPSPSSALLTAPFSVHFSAPESQRPA